MTTLTFQNTLNAINNFQDAHYENEQVMEFTNALWRQLHNIFKCHWFSKEELALHMFSDADVLESVCEEDEATFDWNEARDLQRDVFNTAVNFFGLA